MLEGDDMERPMLEVGTRHTLKVLRDAPEGLRLEAEVLLPRDQAPAGCAVGAALDVFVFADGDGSLLASTRAPKAMRDEVAFLKVVAVNASGAFLDWGMVKDLLLPWKEVGHDQRHRLKVGQKVMVKLGLDPQRRMTASARLDDLLSDHAEGLRAGQEVPILVAAFTDLGVKVVVDHRFWGLVHRSDVFCELSRGQARRGWVKAVRPDGKVDMLLAAPGHAKVDEGARRILAELAKAGGFLPFTDHSQPQDIYARFGMSKKAFKQSLGTLYRERRVQLEPQGIRLPPAS
jgi:predicted RNA-binding protein (virulence factor B family)